MLNIQDIQHLCHDECIVITKHARIRLTERDISVAVVKHIIQTGKIIKQYENDKPFPSCLILGVSEQNRHLHIVVSIDNGYIYVITAYYPNEHEWEADYSARKERLL